MSRGHGWVQQVILETIMQSPRYGFTDSDLVGHVYQAYDDEITDAQIVAVRRAVRALLAEGVVVEKARDAERRRIGFAGSAGSKRSTVRLREPRVAARSLVWLRCVPCDVHWQRQGAELCWSCGGPGEPLSRPAV
jgi:hypothetical protein